MKHKRTRVREKHIDSLKVEYLPTSSHSLLDTSELLQKEKLVNLVTVTPHTSLNIRGLLVDRNGVTVE